jgi:hypothetical protein
MPRGGERSHVTRTDFGHVVAACCLESHEFLLLPSVSLHFPRLPFLTIIRMSLAYLFNWQGDVDLRACK